MPRNLNRVTRYILFKTANGNNYLFSSRFNQILLIHPLLRYLIGLFEKGRKVNELLNDNSFKNIKIRGYKIVSKKELQYYYKKFKFLYDKGYFKNTCNHLNQRYKGEDIKKYLSNTYQVTFEVTDRCNLRCEYCVYGKLYSNHVRQKKSNFDFKTAKKILDYLTELWNSELNDSLRKSIWIGFYGGEPLLNMDFISKIVEYSKTISLRSNYFAYTMTTNALLLDKYIEFLEKNKFKLLISLDGGTEDNNYYRKLPNKKPAFEKIYNNVLLLQNRYPKYFADYVDFNTVLHNKNYSYKALIDFFMTNFNKVPSISKLSVTSVNKKYKQDFLRIYQNSSSKAIVQNNNIIEKPHRSLNPSVKFIERYSGMVYNNYINLLDNYGTQGFIPTGTCAPFTKKIFITVDGKIFPCEKLGDQYSLGRMDKVIQNMDFDNIARKYNDLFDKIKDNCNRCFVSTNCSRCVFREEVSLDNPSCKTGLDKGRFKRFLSRNLNLIEKNATVISQISDINIYIYNA